MTENRTILILSGVGSLLMVVGLILLTAFDLVWVGSAALVIGLVVLGIGWYRFVENQRRSLWGLQTEVKNLRERQSRLAEDVSEISQRERDPEIEKTQLALEGVRDEGYRHEAKIRELERALLSISEGRGESVN